MSESSRDEGQSRRGLSTSRSVGKVLMIDRMSYFVSDMISIGLRRSYRNTLPLLPSRTSLTGCGLQGLVNEDENSLKILPSCLWQSNLLVAWATGVLYEKRWAVGYQPRRPRSNGRPLSAESSNVPWRTSGDGLVSSKRFQNSSAKICSNMCYHPNQISLRL